MLVQKKAALISLVTSAFVLFLKFWAYKTTHSAALFSDALETVVNVITAAIAIYVIQFALQPADEDHPYGHGKLEYFSAAFEGGLVFFAGLVIIFEGVSTFYKTREIKELEIGLTFTLVATFINLVVGLYLKKTGLKNQSAALQASGIHLLSDVKTTAGIIFGLILFHWTGLIWIDSLMAVIVGFWLLTESYSLIKQNISLLLDQRNLETVSEIAEKIKPFLNSDIIDIHNLKIIQSGPFQHIDAHMVVPEFYDIKKVHEVIHQFENNILKTYKLQGEFAFHTDPCAQKYCSVCDIDECKIRQNAFIKKQNLNSDHLVSGPKYGK